MKSIPALFFSSLFFFSLLACNGGALQCGNGVLDEGELCENFLPGDSDGCLDDCTVAPGHMFFGLEVEDGGVPNNLFPEDTPVVIHGTLDVFGSAEFRYVGSEEETITYNFLVESVGGGCQNDMFIGVISFGNGGTFTPNVGDEPCLSLSDPLVFDPDFPETLEGRFAVLNEEEADTISFEITVFVEEK